MPTQQAGSFMTLYSFFPLIIIFIIFYFLLIRPQKKQEKEHQKMLSALAKNDEIVTTGGIHGTIVNVKDKSVVVRVDDNVKIEVEKNCIAFKNKTDKVA
ncbi:MAG: preprotein translocase subunit YajC [Candidatus Omnitrophica bacterium]|nr:preprotein translocase subunit YajC [Candidatus Omnitrophota bacterium]